MSLANVNIGAAPDDNTGDPLRTAFNKINTNFANLAGINGNANVVVYATGNANVTAVYNPGVESVAGRTGNVVLTVNDIIGAASIGYVNSLSGPSLKAANVTVVSGNITLSFANAWNKVTLTESVNQINFSDLPAAGRTASTVLEIVQDATGSRTITGTSFVTAGGVGLDISLVANSTSLVSFVASSGGGKIFGISAGKNWF